jgi:hypothetical protein
MVKESLMIFPTFLPSEDFFPVGRLLVYLPKIFNEYMYSRGFTKIQITVACGLKFYWYLWTLSLKGVFSKPSGKMIVSPNLWFLS